MFKLIDSNQYYLSNTNDRWIHIATIAKGLREFMFMMDRQTSKTYIEEITGGSLKWINDDDLHSDLCNFIEELGLNRFSGS